MNVKDKIRHAIAVCVAFAAGLLERLTGRLRDISDGVAAGENPPVDDVAVVSCHVRKIKVRKDSPGNPPRQEREWRQREIPVRKQDSPVTLDFDAE